MEEKIYKTILILGVFLIIATTLITTYLHYDIDKKNNKLQLENYLELFIMSSLDSYESDLIKISTNKESKINKPNENVLEKKINNNYILLELKDSKKESGLLISLITSISLSLIFLVLTNIISSRLSYDIFKPINKAALYLEDPNDKSLVYEGYDELLPLISKLNIYRDKTKLSMDLMLEKERFRKEFTANVSHELKTPLTSIKGYAELLETGLVKPEDVKKFSSIIQKEGDRLLSLIDSILEISKLESPSVNVSFQTINLYSLLENIINRLLIKTKDKNIKIKLSGDKIKIKGDIAMLEEAIYNLVDNAIKYNVDNGKIQIHLKEFANYKLLSIKDTGIGIPKEELNRIFERFYRVDKSRKGYSSGLGLAIVKHIMELHNAKIDIDSSVNKGTIIYIKFKS